MRELIKYFLMKLRLDPLYLWLRLQGIVRYDKRSKMYIRDVKGNKFHLNPMDCGISRALARDGIREKESVEALFRYVQPDMTILDLGANIGFYVLLEAQILAKGSGRIIAIEPGPENIRLLKLNIVANDYTDRVKIFHGAVTNHSGTVQLRLSPYSNCHRLEEVSSPTSDMKTIDVPAFSFPDILKQSGITLEELDFLRMDIEGAEYLILPEILDLLKQKDSFLIFIEFHPDEKNLTVHKQILQSLESMGYRCLTVTKEYKDNGHIRRRHYPNATIEDLYTAEMFLRGGGTEVFMQKGKFCSNDSEAKVLTPCTSLYTYKFFQAQRA